MMSETSEKATTLHLSIPFPSQESATIAYKVLSVDKELKGSGVQRQTRIESTNLIVDFQGEELKKLRVAVNSFIKNTLLIVKTIEQFTS